MSECVPMAFSEEKLDMQCFPVFFPKWLEFGERCRKRGVEKRLHDFGAALLMLAKIFADVMQNA